MNKKERVFSALTGKDFDRRPLALLLSLYGAKLISCPLKEYYSNSEFFIEGQIAAFEKFNSDILFSPFCLASFAEIFGAEVHIPKKCAPNISKQTKLNINELLKTPLPDINVNKNILYLRHSILGLSKKYGQNVPIAAILPTPPDLAALVFGFEKWLEILLFNKETATKIMHYFGYFFILIANAFIADGADCIIAPCLFINPGFITEKIVSDTVAPFLNQAFKAVERPILVHSGGRKMGKFAGILSEFSNVIGLVPDTSDNLNEVNSLIKPGKVIIGNIDGPRLVRYTESSIRKLCISLLERMKDNKNYIIGTSRADIDYDTPEENILCISNAVKEFYN